MRIHYLGALLIAGCGDAAVESIEYDDVARMVGATIATADGGATAGVVNDSILLAFGGTPEGFTRESGMISGAHGALGHRYIIVVCRDREGRVQKPCNQMTHTATMIASWSGSIRGPALDLRSGRQGMWTLAALQTRMPTITGSSRLQAKGTVGGRAYELTATESETMVAPSYMMGGSIHLDLVVTRVASDLIEAEITADVRFDLRTASLTLDGERRYCIDLATGTADR